MFRLFPGNIADVSTVADLLTRMDLIDEGRVIAAVLDRGYFSLENLVRCKDAGYKVLIAAKMDVSWVKEAAEEVMSDLWDAELVFAAARLGAKQCKRKSNSTTAK